jgi:hypothetical protein
MSGVAAVMIFLGQKLVLSKDEQGGCQALFFNDLAGSSPLETVKA